MLTEKNYAGEFLLSEAAGTRSRDQIVLDGGGSGQTYEPGQVLGQVSLGALSGAFAAIGANTGNPTCGAITVAAGTPVAEYDIQMVDATHYVVNGPDVEVGHGVLGAAFNAGGLGFTLTAGGVACIAGDSFKIVVSAAAATNAGRYVPVNAAATDGSQHAKAICWAEVVAPANGAENALAVTRDAEVKGAKLAYPTGATDNQKAAWLADLATHGIVARS